MKNRVPLDSVALVFNGKTPSKSEQRDSGHPVLKIKDVQEGREFCGKFESFVDDQFYERFESKRIEQDDVLVLNAAHNADYVGSKQFRASAPAAGAIATGEWLLARSKSSKLLQSYLWHWFQTPSTRFHIRKAVKGIHLYPKDVAKFQIPLPPIDEQKRIAAILDKADAIRRKREEALKLADDLLRATFLDMFGDPLSPAKDAHIGTIRSECELFAGNSLPKGEKFSGQDGGYLLLKVSDLNATENAKIVVSAKEWLSGKVEVRRSLVAPKGSIVFPKRGGAISTNKKRILGRPAILDPNLMAVSPKAESTISFNYLRSWFELLDLVTISSGSSVPQLNKKDVEPLELTLPSRREAHLFESFSEKMRQVHERQSAAKLCSEDLFASLSQRAFRGEL